MDKISKVLNFLDNLTIPYTLYRHSPLPTIEIALEYWRDIPGTRHYPLNCVNDNA